MAQADVLRKAFTKMLAAAQGVGLAPVVIGGLAHQAWGVKIAPQQIDLLVATSEGKRDQLLSAARGEGMQQVTIEGPTLRFSYTDAKLGGSVNLEVGDAVTPAQKQILTRAQPQGIVLDVLVPLAACEDLILASVSEPETLIELLRATAGRMDAGYLKKEAEAAGVFDKIKVAWQQAKARG